MSVRLESFDYDRLKLDNFDELGKRLDFEFSNAIRTRRRALLFLAINFMQPVTRMGLRELGYRDKTIAAFTKQAKHEGLIYEKGFLFSLTEYGDSIVVEITKEAFLATWYNGIIHDNLRRTRVRRQIVGS